MGLVRAHEAKRQVMKVLTHPIVSNEALASFRARVMKGEITGRFMHSCFFGIISQEIGLTHDALKRLFSFPSDWKENPIEVFAYDICAGQTPEKNSDLAHILMWCDEAIAFRDKLSRHNSTTRQEDDAEEEAPIFI